MKYEREIDAPGPTLTGNGSAWEIVYRNGNQPNSAERPAREPVPTVHFGHNLNEVRWYDRRQGSTRPDGERVPARPIPVTEAAPTIAADGLAKGRDVWTTERPATTLAGDPRLAQPGHKKDAANPDSPGRMENAVRVTVQQAAILQTFPPDHPWQGSRTKQFQQVGNAVPPLLAKAILAALLEGKL